MLQRFKFGSISGDQSPKKATSGCHEKTFATGYSFPNRRYFLTVSLVNMLLFMGTSLPTPLYQLYTVEFNMTPMMVTIIFAACPIAIVPSLFVFGPFGDKYGSERLLKMAVVLGIISATLLAISDSWFWLVLGRIGQGIAVGAASGNATAAMVEFEPSGNKRRASQMASISLLLGLIIGPLLSASVVEWLPSPTQLVFMIYAGLLITVLGVLFTMKNIKFSTGDSDGFPKYLIPNENRLCFLSMSFSVGLVFTLSGFYFSLMPTYANALLRSSIGLGSVFVSIMVLASLLVQFLIKNLHPKKLVLIGQFCIAAGLAFVVIAQDQFPILHLFFGAIICGAAYGTTLQGAITIVNMISTSEQRSSVASIFYAIAYLFLAIPIIILGFALEFSSVFYTIRHFSLILSIAAIANMILLLILNFNCGEKQSALS